MQVTDFLSAFFPDPEHLIRLRILPPKGGASLCRPQIIATTGRELAQTRALQNRLKRLNHKGGIYFVVNAGGDTDDSITDFTACFCERDDLPIPEQHAILEKSPLPTSIRVETAKSVHAYWLLAGNCTAEEWRGAQERLISNFNSDPAIKNPSRMMRLPCFNHLSIDAIGRIIFKPVEVLEFQPSRRYSVAGILAAFPVNGGEKARNPAQPESNGLYRSWDDLNAELRRRMLTDPSCKIKGEWAHLRGHCHDGRGDSALAVNLASGAYMCQNRCATPSILRAFGLPEIPNGGAGGGHQADATVAGSPTRGPETLPPVYVFNRTDVGNAKRLVASYGVDLRYCYQWRRWLVWDGRQWRLDETGEVERRAKNVVRSIYVEASQAGDAEEAKPLAQYAIKSENIERLKAMIEAAQSESGIPISPDELDTHPYLLNVTNGTLDLRTREKRQHRREDLITRLIRLPYEPEATAPLWHTFLGRIFNNDQELIHFIQRASGYSLTGDTTEQCLFILFGPGDNGKTTFVEVIYTVSGPYAMKTSCETLLAKPHGGIRNDIARLKGVRLVTASETPEGRRLDESLVKDLTGGDTVSARFLYSESFDFRPESKIWMSTNHKPIIRGSGHAIWRRIRVIPFDVTIPQAERDPTLPHKLREEAVGILAWAVAGAEQWWNYRFGDPPEVRNATDSYRDEMDVLGAFIDECCLKAPSASVGSGELYGAYKAWCERSGEYAASKKAFALGLTERGFHPDKGTGGKRIRCGMKLTESGASGG